MGRLARAVKAAWTRARIRRYHQRQDVRSRQAALERLDQQENGGNPYGPPPMAGGGGM